VRRPVQFTTIALVLAVLVSGGACRRDTVAKDARRATATTVRELAPKPGELALPLKQGSIRFAVIGDSGRGDQPQHEVARQMVAWREKFSFDFVIMLGDNIYPPHAADDFVTKFEEPYRALLDAGVTFHAAIGNHDPPTELDYGKFNMDGKRYYTFRRSERRLEGLTGAAARFFVLDSRSFDPAQLAWLRDELARSESTWKICYFHHPLYTSGRYSAGAQALRVVLEPILIAGDVDVVLAGHEHFYERLQPRHGISYFISGGAGSLRANDIRSSPLNARGFDTDYHFMMMEIAGGELYFQAISRTGQTVDAGVITRTGS
jgi:calcineurin-like phosphoesterase family protein